MQTETSRWSWGIWHFAAKSHTDVKRVYSRLGNLVSGTTVRKALDSMTGLSLAHLRDSVKDVSEGGETEWCLVLDNGPRVLSYI
jgi:hypothetical protein